MSTQGDSPLSSYAQIDSPWDESNCNNYLTFAKIDGCLMVTFAVINQMVIVEDTDNAIGYIKTNPLNLERTSTIRVKQEDQDSESIHMELLHQQNAKLVSENWPHAPILPHILHQ